MRRLAMLVLALVASLLAAAGTHAQDRVLRMRFASVVERVVDRHRARAADAPTGAMRPEFRTALERGVVDRLVFGTERGVIPRPFLVPKPIRVLAGPEAAGLGGRGAFELLGISLPASAGAWVEVEIEPRTDRPDDVLVLEIGGELAAVTQVLDDILVASPDGRFVELGLAPGALLAGDGVPVLKETFGRPLARPDAGARFRGVPGVEFLVVRSPVEAMVGAATTPRGRADASPHWARGWQEGDRVLVRVPHAALRAGPPGIVLSWRDRVPLAPLGEGR